MTVASEPSKRSTLDSGSTVPRWLVWSALAVVSTLTHTLIDGHIGLWGDTSDELSPLQAANTLSSGAVYGWWILTVVVASHGDRWALRSAFLLAGVYAFLLHGVVAFIVAPPPSAAFPYQDLAHASSLVVGGIAAVLIRGQLRTAALGGRRYLFIGAVLVIVVSQALSGLTFAQSVG